MKTVFWGIKGRRALAFRAMKELCLTTAFLQKKPYTCIEVLLETTEGKLRSSGFSKAMWPDEWDPLLGEEIARRRAIKGLYSRVIEHKNFDKILAAMLDTLDWNISDIFTDPPAIVPGASEVPWSYMPGKSFSEITERNESA